MARNVLILGAKGRFGRNAALAFDAAGWTIRTYDRSRDDLKVAANGVDVIVNGWNPPYPDWARQVPELHARVCRVAQSTDATVIVPGNVYVFGAEAPLPWSEKTPHLATNPLGRIRRDMEASYRHADVRTIVLRAGDFIDNQQSGNWFDRIMTPKLSQGTFVYPGDPSIDHAWSYLPDLTRAAVQLAEMREQLPKFSDIPFPGYTLTGQQMVQALEMIVGRKLKLKQMNWWPLQVAAPIWPMARCLVEMSYLWEIPHRLEGERFDELLPDFRATPVNAALEAAVNG